MPIDNDGRVALTLRLQTAFAEALENYTSKLARIDILGDVALAQQWLTIGATYSGIEQTLKYLIALQKNLTIDELLVERGIVENLGEEPEQRTRYRTHELGMLFSRLDDGLTALLIDQVMQAVGVVGAVREDVARGQALDEVVGGDHVVLLSWPEIEAHWQA